MHSALAYIDLIGRPFEFGARGPEAYDCWGLVMAVSRRFGRELPDFGAGCEFDPTAIHTVFKRVRTAGRRVGSAQQGDVVTLNYPHPGWMGHVGIVVAPNLFLHARSSTGSICERLDAPQWRRRIEGFYTYAG